MINKVLFFCLFIFNAFVGIALENSVVSNIEKFEILENLPQKKYSQKQYASIAKALERKGEKIRAVSYNMLFNLYDHNLDECNRWPQRYPRIVELLHVMQPDVIGVQELYKDQLDDLMPLLKDQYDFFAKPCSDGELNGIFYRKERFDVCDKYVCYMTQTPQVPSSETLTMITLRDRKTGKRISILNTHLAFGNIDKREFQAQFIADFIKTLQNPVLLTGDFNTFSQRLDISNLPFYDGDYIQSILESASLTDAKKSSVLGHLGPISTFTNVNGDGKPFLGTGTPGIFLDHMYVTDDITVLIHAVDSATIEGHFPSDHMPVLIDFIL